MSVTVRLWKDYELRKAQRARTEEERWLATLLLNKNTYTKGEMVAYNKIPMSKRHSYDVYLDCTGQRVGDSAIAFGEDPIIIRATDVKMLKKFIKSEYVCPPGEIFERKVTLKKVRTSYREV